MTIADSALLQSVTPLLRMERAGLKPCPTTLYYCAAVLKLTTTFAILLPALSRTLAIIQIYAVSASRLGSGLNVAVLVPLV